MEYFNDCMKQLESSFGNEKDNVIVLSTVSLKLGKNGLPVPSVRNVDAYYEAGVFYVVTYALSNKMKEISNNPNVSITVAFESFVASGVGENLGWVLDPKNSSIRAKLRNAFSNWYDAANNENDKNCCFLAIHLSKATLMEGHAEAFINIDFDNKTATRVSNK